MPDSQRGRADVGGVLHRSEVFADVSDHLPNRGRQETIAAAAKAEPPAYDRNFVRPLVTTPLLITARPA